MISGQVVAEKVAEVTKLAASFVAQAAAGLVKTAGSLSADQMFRRLDRASAALRGEEVSTSGVFATMQNPSLQIAKGIVESYTFDKKTGVSTFTIPAGVTDVEAMRALNEYFRKNLPLFDRGAVYVGDLEWYEELPKAFPDYCNERDYSEARQITIAGVVEGTKAQNRTTQEGVLKGDSRGFADPRDQALAAAIHACKHEGEDLFKDLSVRGLVPGFAVCTDQRYGTFVIRFKDDDVSSDVAASGSRFPEKK